MSRTLFGFYDLDAAPQHGLAGDLASRLGSATEAAGFIDGAVYVRSDNAAVAIQLQYGDEDGWEERGAVATLLQAADWRSRENDARSYRLVRQVRGDGDDVKDSTFYIVQRFVVKSELQDGFVSAICNYVEHYAAPIPGFLAGDAYASLDGGHIVFVMPWAHESALNSLENREGSLRDMQTHLRMSERHSYASYQRSSFLRATGARYGA
ncbi:MAG: hypothetical protein IAI50_10245 [Candidatus Eremiobacteraeota bacterium]|nr:hypothetical protein [Candidatus Eremiobacteraeota bacterium]